jgi:hypothetical protein
MRFLLRPAIVSAGSLAALESLLPAVRIPRLLGIDELLTRVAMCPARSPVPPPRGVVAVTTTP